MQYLAYYLAAINVVLYALMGLDKLFAKLQKRRIPEKTLFAFAIVGGALGGALGGTLGMYGFRHKTLHKTFDIGFPLLAIVQIAAVVFLVIKFA